MYDKCELKLMYFLNLFVVINWLDNQHRYLDKPGTKGILYLHELISSFDGFFWEVNCCGYLENEFVFIEYCDGIDLLIYKVSLVFH